VLVQDSRPVILCSAGTAGDEFARSLHRFIGRAHLGAPQRLETHLGPANGVPGRLVRTARGTLIFPLVRSFGLAAPAIACMRRAGQGRNLVGERGRSLPGPPTRYWGSGRPKLSSSCVSIQCSRAPRRSTTAPWGAPLPSRRARIRCRPRSAKPAGVVLAWTDAPPDTSWALPGLRAVRLALSSDGGKAWRPLRPLVWSAGRTPWVPGLARSDNGITALVVRRAREASLLDCGRYPLRQLQVPVEGNARTSKFYAPIQCAQLQRSSFSASTPWNGQALPSGSSSKATSCTRWSRGTRCCGLAVGGRTGRGPVASKPLASTPPGGARLLDTQQGLRAPSPLPIDAGRAGRERLLAAGLQGGLRPTWRR
jgi:hypothetical protein